MAEAVLIGSSNCYHFSSIIGIFMCFSSLIQTLPTSHCFDDVKHDFVTRSLTIRYVTENHYVKCPVHFFPWKIFHSSRYEQ